MNTQQQIEFIAQNLNAVSEYHVSDLYLEAVRTLIRERYGVHVETTLRDAKGSPVLRSDLTFEENWAAVQRVVVAPKFKDAAECALCQKLSYVYRSFYLQPDGSLKASTYDNLVNPYFISLLRYAVNGVDDSTLREAHAVADKLRDQYGSSEAPYGWTALDGDLAGVEIRRFKNGKLQFRGLSDEAMARLRYAFELTSRR